MVPGVSYLGGSFPRESVAGVSDDDDNSPAQDRSCRSFTRKLQEGYSRNFLVHLASVYAGQSGALVTAVSLGQLPLYRGMTDMTGYKYHQLVVVSRLPWAAVSLIAFSSDMCACFKYQKRYRMFLASLLGAMGLWVLGRTPAESGLVSGLDDDVVAAACFLLATLTVVVNGTLCLGKCTEIISSFGGSVSIISYNMGCVQVGTFCVALAAGFVTDHFGFRGLLMAGAFLAAQGLLPSLLGWMPEASDSAQRCVKCVLANEHRKICRLVVVQVLSSIAVALSVVFGEEIGISLGVDTVLVHVAVCIVGAMAIVIAAMKTLSKHILRVTLYMLISRVLYLGMRGTMDSWYTAGEECRGQMIWRSPGFEESYYYNYGTVAEGFFGLLAVVAFERFLLDWQLRSAFWFAAGVRVLTGLVELVIVLNLHLGLGIPDAVAFLFGAATFRNLTEVFEFMPGIVFMGQLAPSQVETTVFALILAFLHYGQALSTALGSLLLQTLGVWIQDPGDQLQSHAPCKDSQLPLALLIGHVLLPLLCFPAAFLLLPKLRIEARELGVTRRGTQRIPSAAMMAPPASAIELQPRRSVTSEVGGPSRQSMDAMETVEEGPEDSVSLAVFYAERAAEQARVQRNVSGQGGCGEGEPGGDNFAPRRSNLAVDALQSWVARARSSVPAFR